MSWTDDRLDDFRDRVDQRFDQVDQRFDQVDQRFERVEQRIDRVDRKVDALSLEMNGRFESLQKTTITMFVTTMSTMVAGFVGVMAAILTQI